jgi:hypothetical protein
MQSDIYYHSDTHHILVKQLQHPYTVPDFVFVLCTGFIQVNTNCSYDGIDSNGVHSPIVNCKIMQNQTTKTISVKKLIAFYMRDMREKTLCEAVTT